MNKDVKHPFMNIYHMNKHIIILIFCLSFILNTSARELAQKSQDWIVHRHFVYQHGSKMSKKYLSKNAPKFEAKLEKILPWVVRIEVQHGITKSGYTSNHGTGIILADGKIVTAKHVLTKNVKDLKAKTKILLTTVDGRVFPAKVVQQGKRDWMILQMEVTDEQKAMLKSPVKLATPVKDETVVFLGYPARLGLDEQGKVQSFHKGDAKKNIPVSKLKPMMIVGSVSDIQKLHIKPLAGFAPVGGMSGGPVFNLKGEVVATQHSVSTTTANDTGKILYYTIEGIPSTEAKP